MVRWVFGHVQASGKMLGQFNFGTCNSKRFNHGTSAKANSEIRINDKFAALRINDKLAKTANLWLISQSTP